MVKVYDSKEDKIQVTDDYDFVTSNDVAAGDSYTPAYVIEAPDNHVIGVHARTPIAPNLQTTAGALVDSSTRIVAQKRDPQGNNIGEAIVFDESYDVFDVAKMRSDERFFRRTSADVMLDEGESLAVYLDIPSGADGFSAANSRLTLGDNVTETGKPVSIIRKDDLDARAQSAVEQASRQKQ